MMCNLLDLLRQEVRKLNGELVTSWFLALLQCVLQDAASSSYVSTELHCHCPHVNYFLVMQYHDERHCADHAWLVMLQDTDRAADLTDLLYETAMLTSGFAIESPKDYAAKVFMLMQAALGYGLEDEEVEAAAPPPPKNVSDTKSKPRREVVEPEVM
jgi:Hsp90 protein